MVNLLSFHQEIILYPESKSVHYNWNHYYRNQQFENGIAFYPAHQDEWKLLQRFFEAIFEAEKQ